VVVADAGTSRLEVGRPGSPEHADDEAGTPRDDCAGLCGGAHVITPRHEYIHGRKRLFANPADFADLYGFVRSLGQTGYLNGYEDAAVGGDDLKETRYGETPPITVHGGSGKLSIFARAKPGEADAPVVIHVVESGESQPATLHGRKGSVPGFGYYILLHQEFLVFAPPRDISPFAHAD
jgi:hypothetical protein